jgi:hypothetical protein
MYLSAAATPPPLCRGAVAGHDLTGPSTELYLAGTLRLSCSIASRPILRITTYNRTGRLLPIINHHQHAGFVTWRACLLHVYCAQRNPPSARLPWPGLPAVMGPSFFLGLIRRRRCAAPDCVLCLFSGARQVAADHRGRANFRRYRAAVGPKRPSASETAVLGLILSNLPGGGATSLQERTVQGSIVNLPVQPASETCQWCSPLTRARTRPQGPSINPPPSWALFHTVGAKRNLPLPSKPPPNSEAAWLLLLLLLATQNSTKPQGPPCFHHLAVAVARSQVCQGLLSWRFKLLLFQQNSRLGGSGGLYGIGGMG